LASVKEVLKAANGNKDIFREYAIQCGEQEQQIALKEQKREMEKVQRRVSELDTIIQKLFESNAAGRISDERFDTLSTGYEQEQSELKEKFRLLTKEITFAEEKKSNTERFLKIAEKYENLTELTPTILRELIEKILVYEPIHVNGKKRIQKIQIYYNFIGRIQLPAETKKAESA